MPQDTFDDNSTLVKGPGVVRQQAITWAIVDPDLSVHIASIGHKCMHCSELD